MKLGSIACAILCLCAACGSDDETRPRYASGIEVDVETGVDTLGDSDLERICHSLDAYVETHVSFDAIAYVACLPPAIVLGGSPEGCEQQLDDCMALFPEPITVQAQLEDQQVCFDDLRQCRTSVTALEGCINVNLDLALDIIDNWSCRGAADPGERDRAARAMDTVNVCADLDAACNRFATLGPD